MRKLVLMLMALVSLSAGAQSAEKLYDQGKELYDQKKYTEAFPKLKAAAEKGHKKAQYRVGKCYEKGRGVNENEKLAFQWYEKSAKQGYHKGQYELGDCYKDGEGVAKNKKLAFEWFKKAAAQENAEAEYALGKCYMKGRGVASNQADARKWFKRAVNNEKGGKEILAEIREEAADGDEDAKAILKLIGK